MLLQRPVSSKYRVRRRVRKPSHAGDSLGIRRLAADIPVLLRRIRPDHQKIRRLRQLAMPGARRQQRHVARIHRLLMPARPTQHQPRRPCHKPQHLMRRRVVMMKRINPIPPLRRPAIRLEYPLARTRRIAARRQNATVEQHRQPFIIRHPSVLPNRQNFCLAAGRGIRRQRKSSERGGEFSSIHRSSPPTHPSMPHVPSR